jgi:hypothetical protein
MQTTTVPPDIGQLSRLRAYTLRFMGQWAAGRYSDISERLKKQG